MAMSVRAMLWLCLWLWSVAVIQCLSPGMAEQKKLYIVHTKHQAKPLSYATHSDWYAATLQSEESLIYTYGTAYHGFAAALDANQAESLRGSPFVLGVYEDIVYSLHTTRTSQFLGLETKLFRSWHGRKSTQGLDQASREVIIGVLDTGVWPESKSFDDTGMTAVPQRWKGACESGPGFSSSACNKKLIGARSFSKGYSFGSKRLPLTPRDTEGHGTHTASTAAGSPVAGASLFGYANGTARGVSPWSRVAAYKVCGKEGCFGADILAGMERAIQDGVDVLSLSLGGGGSGGYYRDPIAIGAFAAMERGIFVSCSAGNGGPRAESLANVAPWVTTVGAGTLDRDFPAYVSLGNGNRLAGVSLYSGRGINHQVSLFYAKGNSSLGGGNLCLPGSLDPVLVRGKLVLCDRGVNARVEKGVVVRDAGGVGMILANTAESGGEAMVADSHLLPAVAVGMTTGGWIRTYARSVKNPTAVLSFAGTVLNVRPSPVVASFSSRGPNTLTPEILKPDVIGPGVNILAAWSGAVGPSEVDGDTRRTQFNIVSGTSMSCPHISGVAALLKAAHPEWSPSAIKSAMMTTAYTLDNTRLPLRDSAVGLHYNSNPWAHGSGHVDPTKAISPGLVYDATADDYLAFLCSLGYTPSQVAAVAKRHNITCTHRLVDPGHLNYPSFSVVFSGGSRKLVTYTRVLTNVGASRSGYRVAVDAPPGVAISVRPKVLVFRSLGEKKTYTVSFVANGTRGPTTSNAFGSISWVNREHQVTSPVAFSWSTL